MLENKNILVGVCASIASYKSAILVRLLVKAGARVRVIMTSGATNFIAPLTLATLSKNPVLIDYFKTDTGEWNSHIDLAAWADRFVVAPLSANTLAKFAHGLCDHLLSAVYLATKYPVYFAPAMDLEMWEHPATQQNINKLISYNHVLIKPKYGALASGLIGEGRMEEPEQIVAFLAESFEKQKLKGKKALVTAGPTYEAIDAVRFISNHSSGKMGYAIAAVLANLGAEVTLVSGPTALVTPPLVHRIDVISAKEMFVDCDKRFLDNDIIVMCAAVADYRAKEIVPRKIKKSSNELALNLVKTIDILASLGERKKKEQILVGFALETSNGEANAFEKLKKKNLDLIVLNCINNDNPCFKSDMNSITMIDRHNRKESFELKSKVDVAKDICQKIIVLCSL